jgi:hypothetical protein
MAGFALTAFVATAGGAQAGARTGTPPVTKGRPAARPAPRPPAPRVSPVVLPTTVGPVITINAPSAAPEVVTIRVPDELPARARVNFTVTPLVEGSVIGRLTGSLAPVARGGTRTILFAVRTPRQLPAGEARLALVRFATQAAAVEIPIVAQVAQARSIRVVPATMLGAARAGTPFTVGYRVSNLGNAADSVSVQLIVPSGWRVLDPTGERPFRLEMHATVDRRVQVVSPENAQGISTLRLLVLAGGLPVAESRFDVQLLGGSVVVGTSGPRLTLGAAAASGPWDQVSHVQTLELEGQIADGTSIWARASTAPWRQGAATYALSRSNILTAPPALQLTSQQWRLGLGVLGTSLSDLTGVNLVGQGATFSFIQPDWRVSAVAANPDLGVRDASGSIMGGRIEATPGRLALSSTVTRLREERSELRELDAMSIGAGWEGILGGRWAGEVARRQFNGTSASGWSSRWSRRSTRDNVEVRYVHAPGGSRAFARAATEMAASGNRRLNDRVSLLGSYWRSSDEGSATLTGLEMNGWSAGTNLMIGDGASATLVARESEFGASTAIGAFGSGERAVDGTLEGRSGTVNGRVTLTASNVRRTTELTDDAGERYMQAAARYSVRASVGAGDARGSIKLNGQYDRSGTGIGFAPVQWSYGVEVEGAVVPGVGDAVRLNAAAERLGGFSTGVQQMTLRAGLEVDLAFDASLMVSAERNPYIVPDAGQGSWMYVVGVSRTMRLPRFSNAGTRGHVYRDVNGNGTRDPGEPGFAGVVLRRGADVTMTDSRGAFVLAGDEHQSFDIDARSLPVGWLTASTTFAPGTRDVGVLAVSPLVVDLELDAADSSRVAAADLSEVVVVARDSSGREWLSRRESRTRAVFDALPPGRYTLSIDASAAREPLRPVADVPPVRVTTGKAVPPVKIVLRARTLRFSTPNPNRK